MPDGHTYRVRASNSRDLRPAIYDLARDKGWPVKELRRDVRTLETVFNELATAPIEEAVEAEHDNGGSTTAAGGEKT
jgi:hypothetical protein